MIFLGPAGVSLWRCRWRRNVEWLLGLLLSNLVESEVGEIETATDNHNGEYLPGSAWFSEHNVRKPTIAFHEMGSMKELKISANV